MPSVTVRTVTERPSLIKQDSIIWRSKCIGQEIDVENFIIIRQLDEILPMKVDHSNVRSSSSRYT